jgi:phosphohistidine phosphatase
MEIYLMRHGQALPATEDAEEPLSRDGVSQIQASAAALKKMGVVPDLIVSSPRRRSRQSAALVAERVNYPHSDIVETTAVQPSAAAEEALTLLRRYPESKAILIAGHLPSLANIAALLLGAPAPLRLRFGNGSLCRIDVPLPAPGQGELAWHLPVEQLRIIAGV